MYDKLILLFVFFGLLMLFSASKMNKRKKIIFFGDSLTKAGTEPIGYITVLKSIFEREGIDEYHLINEGVNGNKVYDLYLRMEENVIRKSPEMIVVFIGVNDVWHKKTHGTGTEALQFEKLYRTIIKRLQATDTKVMLCTPAVIGEMRDNANEQDEDLNQYAAIIKNIGSNLQLPVCDLRSVFQNYLQTYNINDASSGVLTTDGVHLNELGNRLVAEALWEKLEVLVK